MILLDAPHWLVAPIQWVILIILVMLFAFDMEKRGETKRDLKNARERKDPAEILTAETLLKMNTCDVIGVPCFILWLVLRHEHLPPNLDMQFVGLIFFCAGVSLILVKRFFERNLRNRLCDERLQAELEESYQHPQVNYHKYDNDN